MALWHAAASDVLQAATRIQTNMSQSLQRQTHLRDYLQCLARCSTELPLLSHMLAAATWQANLPLLADQLIIDASCGDVLALQVGGRVQSQALAVESPACHHVYKHGRRLMTLMRLGTSSQRQAHRHCHVVRSGVEICAP